MGVYIGDVSSVFATQGPCPEGFHVPTKAERVNLNTWGQSLGAWTSSGGSSMGAVLKLPLVGNRPYNSGTASGQGTYANYWSCSASGTYATLFYYKSNQITINDNAYRGAGAAIRPFKNEVVTPDSSWTALYGTIGSNGIFHNSTLGLITLVYGSNYITIADKNLGATTVWNNGNTLSAANCGNYYQWGNDYGFPYTGTITTSTTLVDTSGYGPLNHYSSSTFIINTASPMDRSSPQNDNLWGGVDGNVELEVRQELKNAYIGEWYISPTSISLDKSSISLATVGQTEQLTATVLPADARQTVTWTSSNTSIATVDSTGLVTCVTPGTCTITATTVNGLTATCSVAAATIIYYDFTTVSSIPSDISVRKGTWSVSSGLKVTNQGATITRAIGDISSKSSFRIEVTGTRTNTSWAGMNGTGITNRQGVSSQSDYVGYQTYYLRKSWRSNASYSDGNGIKYEGTANSKTDLTALTTTTTIGNYALYFEVNLNTGYVTGGGTVPDSWSTNYTLSSSQLAQLKTMQYATFWTYPANSTSDTLQTLKITIL